MGCSLPSRSTYWLLRKAMTAWAIVTRFVACSFIFVLPSFRLVQDQPIMCQVKEEEPPFSRRGGGGRCVGRGRLRRPRPVHAFPLPARATQASPLSTTPAYTGRYRVMSLRKRLRPRRGGGWDEARWGRLRRPRPGSMSAFSLLPGRRKRPHSTHPPPPRLTITPPPKKLPPKHPPPPPPI